MACCGNSEVDKNDISTQGQAQAFGRDALRHPNALWRIVHIQAVIRGFLARKRVRQIKMSSGYNFMQYHN